MKDNQTQNSVPTIAITPAGITNVPFNEQLANVQKAMEDRNTAREKLEECLTAINKILQKWEIPGTILQPNITEIALRNIADTSVVRESPSVFEDDVQELVRAGYYCRIEGTNAPKILALLEKRFPGFSEFLAQCDECRQGAVPKQDEKKTKEMRAELHKAIDEYAHIEKEYKTAAQRLSDVSYYISMVDKIADISTKANKNNSN